MFDLQRPLDVFSELELLEAANKMVAAELKKRSVSISEEGLNDRRYII